MPIQLIIRYAVLIVVQAGGVLCFIYMVGILGERIRYDLRRMMFNHLQDLSLSYYSRTPVGWIMSRVTSDSDRVAELMTWGLLDITWAVVNISTASFFMIIINWRLALIVFAILPVLIVVAIKFRQKILVEYRRVRRINSKITGAYNENITGVRVVKALSREDENLREFGQLTGEMYRAGYRAAWLSALFLPTVQIISAVALASVVAYGGIQAQLGHPDHRGDPGFHLLHHVHDVADPGHGSCFRRDAAGDCFGGTDLLPGRCRSRRERPGRGVGSRLDPGRNRVRSRRFLL